MMHACRLRLEAFLRCRMKFDGFGDRAVDQIDFCVGAEGREEQLRCIIRYSPLRHEFKYGKQRFPFFC